MLGLVVPDVDRKEIKKMIGDGLSAGPANIGQKIKETSAAKTVSKANCFVMLYFASSQSSFQQLYVIRDQILEIRKDVMTTPFYPILVGIHDGIAELSTDYVTTAQATATASDFGGILIETSNLIEDIPKILTATQPQSGGGLGLSASALARSGSNYIKKQIKAEKARITGHTPELLVKWKPISSIELSFWKKADRYFERQIPKSWHGCQIPEFHHFQAFFETFLDGSKLWNCSTSLTAVYNPTHRLKFCDELEIIKRRHSNSPTLFNKQDWTYENAEISDRKQKVASHFRATCEKFPWNIDKSLPDIIPVLHGTSLRSAKFICGEGFANISQIDDGYYGSGIYLTSSAKYALPYMGYTKEPTLLLCYAIPGMSFHPATPLILGSSCFFGI